MLGQDTGLWCQLACGEWMRCGLHAADSLPLQVVGTMGGGKVGTQFIKRLQQGWDVKTLLYYGASTCR